MLFKYSEVDQRLKPEGRHILYWRPFPNGVKRMVGKTEVLWLEKGLHDFPILQLPDMSRTSTTDLIEVLKPTYHQCVFDATFTKTLGKSGADFGFSNAENHTLW